MMKRRIYQVNMLNYLCINSSIVRLFSELFSIIDMLDPFFCPCKFSLFHSNFRKYVYFQEYKHNYMKATLKI